MKIAGVWSGHDASFCVLENGHPLIHAEYERYNREKSPQGDALSFLFERYPKGYDEIVHFVSCFPTLKTTQHKESFQNAIKIAEKNSGKFHFVSHHKSHAAHAFYSSNFEKAAIITLDGGGTEDDEGSETAATIWVGNDKKLHHVKTFHPQRMNIGGVWTRITRYIFKLQNGWPLGSQEGTVMAMAAFGDSNKYYDDFFKMLTTDIIPAGFKPPDQPHGAYVPGKDPRHPYLDKWAKIAEKSEQDKFDLAASLQNATEDVIKNFINYVLSTTGETNLCLAGGVALNSVAMGKIKEWFPKNIRSMTAMPFLPSMRTTRAVNEIYIPPVPYDGGLTIGAAQYIWHDVLGNDRIAWDHNFVPYLGEVWDRNYFNNVVEKFTDKIQISPANDDDLVQKLYDGNIVSVFRGKSESGRRALGNRSILVDPRNSEMKDVINAKVKHRSWFRPFAPSILYECVDEWFTTNQESPYMQFVLKFKPEKIHEVPAVVHKDGTARLQTVRKEDNKWYYNFLCKWNEKTGVPIILNTSFNDREPICENIEHAISCFLGTQIDYLYFPEFKLLIERKE